MERATDTVGGPMHGTGDGPDGSTAAGGDPGSGPWAENEHVAAIASSGERGTVTLVGVVHDHPASVSRVRRVVEAVDPAVLALELPPLAVPLYETHAVGGGTPPSFGGEFSAAVQAASTDDVVGIDGPSPGFVRTFLGRLSRERAAPGVVARSLRSLASTTGTAVTCRAAAWVTRNTSLRVGVGSATSHETSWMDSPSEWDTDERQQIRSAAAVRSAFQAPPSSQYRSASRERHMADRLSAVRERGNVVAVVGAGHFDSLSEKLESPR